MQVRPRGRVLEEVECSDVNVKAGCSICLMSERNCARQGAAVVDCADEVDMAVV